MQGFFFLLWEKPNHGPSCISSCVLLPAFIVLWDFPSHTVSSASHHTILQLCFNNQIKLPRPSSCITAGNPFTSRILQRTPLPAWLSCAGYLVSHNEDKLQSMKTSCVWVLFPGGLPLFPGLASCWYLVFYWECQGHLCSFPQRLRCQTWRKEMKTH